MADLKTCSGCGRKARPQATWCAYCKTNLANVPLDSMLPASQGAGPSSRPVPPPVRPAPDHGTPAVVLGVLAIILGSVATVASLGLDLLYLVTHASGSASRYDAFVLLPNVVLIPLGLILLVVGIIVVIPPSPERRTMLVALTVGAAIAFLGPMLLAAGQPVL